MNEEVLPGGDVETEEEGFLTTAKIKLKFVNSHSRKTNSSNLENSKTCILAVVEIYFWWGSENSAN